MVLAELVCEVWAGEQHKEQTFQVPFNPDHTRLSAVLMNGHVLHSQLPFQQSTSSSVAKLAGLRALARERQMLFC